MTQDQYDQTRGPGYVVHDDAVPDEENEEYAAGQSRPKTAFQKVASALRGDPDETDQGQPDPDQAAGNRVVTSSEAATGSDAMAPSTDRTNADISRTDTPGANPPWVTDQDEAAAVTSPDVPVPPDLSGTDPLTRQAAADVPAGTAQTAGVPAYGAAAAGALAGEATGIAGRHAAAAPAGTESRPGEAAGTRGDFSDLGYGSLIADGAVYLEQWQQVQFKFVDDPHASVTEAAEIVAQVTARLEAAIQERQRAIAEQQRSLRGRWGEGSNADTEGLRETLRLYRTFLDQLIGPGPVNQARLADAGRAE